MKRILDRIRSIKTSDRRLSVRVIGFGLLGLLLVIIVVFAIMIYGLKQQTNATKTVARIIPYPAAMVNGSIIPLAQFNFTRDYSRHFYDASHIQYDSKTLDKQVLDELEEERIVSQQATSDHITVSNADVDTAFKQLVDKSGQDEVNKVLHDLYNLDETQFKQLIYHKLLKEKLQSDLESKNQWSQVQVRHILIKVDPNADQKTVADAKAKADADLAQIKAGTPFDQMAKQNSEDTASKDQGGELGYVSRGQTVTEFENAIFAQGVKKGDLLGPIRTQYGWHIIQVEDIRGDKDFTIWRNQAHIYQFITI